MSQALSATLNRELKSSAEGGGPKRPLRTAPKPPRPRDAHAHDPVNRPRDDEPCRRMENAVARGDALTVRDQPRERQIDKSLA